MSHAGLAFFFLFLFYARRLSTSHDAASAAQSRASERQIRKERREAARAAREAARAAQGVAIRAFFSCAAALLRADTRAWRLFMVPFADRRRRRIQEAAISLKSVDSTRFWL
jgi:hypothetical protein